MRKYVHLPRRHSKSQSPSNPKPRRLEGVQRHYIVYSDIIIIIIIIIIIVVVAVVVAVRHAWGGSLDCQLRRHGHKWHQHGNKRSRQDTPQM